MSTFLNISTVQANLHLPVSIEKARQQLRAEGFSVDDALIETYIRAAAADIENNYSLSLLPAIFEEEHVSFPAKHDCIFLKKRPVVEIVEIKYLNSEAVWQNLSVSDVVLTKRYATSCLLPKPSLDWPEVYCGTKFDNLPKVRVKYKAGYECDKIPYDIVHAILYKITLAYERREDPPKVSARASDALLSSHYSFLKNV